MIGSRHRRIFAHFFDIHFLEEKGVKRFEKQALAEAKLAMRLGLLLADEILVPAASYFESNFCRHVVDDFRNTAAGVRIRLAASAANLDEFNEDKCRQYGGATAQGIAYRHAPRGLVFPWRQRTRGATSDIIRDWREAAIAGKADEILRSLAEQVPLPVDHEKRWRELPERLGTDAFVAERAIPLLLGTADVPLGARNRVRAFINHSYFASYTADLRAGVFRNMRWLEPNAVLSSGGDDDDLDFTALQETCRSQGVLAKVVQWPASSLLDLRDNEEFAAAVVQASGKAVQGALALSAFHLTGTTRMTENRPERPLATPREKRMPEKRRAPGGEPSVLIVTALFEEHAAVRATFDREDAKPISKAGDPNIYLIGHYGLGDGAHAPSRRVLLATASKLGNASAAALGAAALRSFPSIQHVLMVGIAGGCPNLNRPDEHVRLGDVVVSNSRGIIEYDDVKLSDGVVEIRGQPQRPAHRMLQAFEILMSGDNLRRRPWEEHNDRALQQLDQSYARPGKDDDVLMCDGAAASHPVDPRRQDGRPRTFGGAIGSSNTLMKDAAKRDELRDQFGVRAIEMEGSGLQTAAWAAGHDILVIRGVCDYADSSKNDIWHRCAALAAAAFARSIVEVLPDEWFT